MNRKDIVDSILPLFKDPRYKRRSLNALSEKTGIKPQDIREAVTLSDLYNLCGEMGGLVELTDAGRAALEKSTDDLAEEFKRALEATKTRLETAKTRPDPPRPEPVPQSVLDDVLRPRLTAPTLTTTPTPKHRDRPRPAWRSALNTAIAESMSRRAIAMSARGRQIRQRDDDLRMAMTSREIRRTNRDTR